MDMGILEENTALASLESGEVDMIYATPEFADKKIDGCKLFDIEQTMCVVFLCHM